ncbi:hypothetical protein PN462_06660 [Spirulina sp. CS-785/01]|uniref:hypothetical protein n=1 Tax=Spirulina sp. CS-785/01 TaxID=3021716 RepID=UPI00232F0C6B|nr:hypothetical protein [Spirulina sp. CS-785/01]MDB9312776.1 hypothetical protein [Spirulina sp. CS-785/01]
MKLSSLCLMLVGTAILGSVPLTLTLSQTQPTQPSNNYPSQEKTSFINSCTQENDGRFRAICECTFNQIQDTYSYEEYQNILQQLRNGDDLPEAVVEMIRDCRADINPANI